MLKDELILLVQMVARHLPNSQPDLKPIQSVEKEEKMIRVECQRIKKVWIDLLFGSTKEHTLKRYIGHQQIVITDLADALYLYHGKIKPASLTIPGTLVECLLDLIEYLIKYFNTYLNENGKLPEASCEELRIKLNDSADHLSAILETIDIDTNLKTCLLNYLSGVISASKNGPITLKYVEYVMNFTETLEAIIEFKDSRDLTQLLVEVLFYLNFNYTGFSQWFQEEILKKMTSNRSQENVASLRKELLFIKSLPVIQNMSYDPKTQPINIQLEYWLDELIKQETLKFENKLDGLPEKLELQLTVPQLALLIRSLYEEGVFTMKSITSLLKFFTAHFMTKKQEQISYGSMSNMYYGGDQFSAYAVRELLLKMVSKINRMYFPA